MLSVFNASFHIHIFALPCGFGCGCPLSCSGIWLSEAAVTARWLLWPGSDWAQKSGQLHRGPPDRPEESPCSPESTAEEPSPRQRRGHCWNTDTVRQTGDSIISGLKSLLNLLSSWACCSCKSASELKKGITLAELCWSASVKAWQCFTIVVLAREDWVSVLVRSSSSISGGNPITTTSFISIRCRNESPKARLWTISRLSNTEVSTCRQSKNLIMSF